MDGKTKTIPPGKERGRMKKHKRHHNQIKDDKQKEYDEMELSQADMADFRRPAYSVRHPNSEYSHAQNRSMAGKLIRAQGEQIRETPADYLARKFHIRGDAGGYRRKSSD